jgi:hypothetical protein
MMKKPVVHSLLAILVALAALALAPAQAWAAAPSFGDVIVSSAKGAKEGEDTFETSTPAIFVGVGLNDVPVGTKLTAVWIAVKAKDVRPNFVFNTTDFVVDKKAGKMTFDVSRPPKGWPTGEFRVDLLINGKKQADATFSIE